MIRTVISSFLVLSSLVTFITGTHPAWGISAAIAGVVIALWKFMDMEKKGLLA